MSEQTDVPGTGRGMRLLLRGFGGTCALTGILLLVFGVVEQGTRSGMAGLAAIGIGLVFLIAALSAFAPIASPRAARHGAPAQPAPAPARGGRR